MPTRETPPTGAPCWVDLLTSDTERSRAFYCQLFGWTAEDPAEEFRGYFSFSKDGVLVAGCMGRQPGVDTPDAWSVYLATDDASRPRTRPTVGSRRRPTRPVPSSSSSLPTRPCRRGTRWMPDHRAR